MRQLSSYQREVLQNIWEVGGIVDRDFANKRTMQALERAGFIEYCAYSKSLGFEGAWKLVRGVPENEFAIRKYGMGMKTAPIPIGDRTDRTVSSNYPYIVYSSSEGVIISEHRKREKAVRAASKYQDAFPYFWHKGKWSRVVY